MTAATSTLTPLNNISAAMSWGLETTNEFGGGNQYAAAKTQPIVAAIAGPIPASQADRMTAG
jgi:hypothetical protein